MSTKIFYNGKVFIQPDVHKKAKFVDCLHTKGGKIQYIGSFNDQTTKAAIASGQAILFNLEGHVVLPGFIDGHMHLLLLGQSLQKLNLEHCQNLTEDRKSVV